MLCLVFVFASFDLGVWFVWVIVGRLLFEFLWVVGYLVVGCPLFGWLLLFAYYCVVVWGLRFGVCCLGVVCGFECFVGWMIVGFWVCGL